MSYCGIVVSVDTYDLDNVFTYKVPEEFEDVLKVGQRIIVPFGVKSAPREAYVYSLFSEVPEEAKKYRLKNIKKIIDVNVHFKEEDKDLIEYIRSKYLSTYIDTIRLLTPPGSEKNIKRGTVKKIFFERDLEKNHIKQNYIDIVNIIKGNDGRFTKSELEKNFALSISSIKTLIKHGYLSERTINENRFKVKEYKNIEEVSLTFEQRLVLDTIETSFNNKFLIHGVTGSGKTEVFIKLLEKIIENGSSAAILVPEISLTPQMIERIKGRLQVNIGVFHSKMSMGEKLDLWHAVNDGDINIVIGARSALFLPYRDLKLVVIDEEHETTYKSEVDPKYDARDIAGYLIDKNGGKLILASATPSLESYYRAQNGEFRLLEMQSRVPGAKMPEVTVVDMREELTRGNKTIFSKLLFDKIKDRLEKNEQVILFLNRRGDSSFVSCRKCGFVYKCPNCDLSLKLHRREGILECHYCGYKLRPKSTCPSCESKYIKTFGAGTEKVHRMTQKAFEGASVERMDLDTMRQKGAFEDIYNRVRDGKVDILVGTQMVTKGFDFKNVTLVGIMAADLTLNLPQYHAAERTFQLLTQVSGRAGRGEKIGEVVLQTYTPDSMAIKCAKELNFKEFYDSEIKIRQVMGYPPFTQIMQIVIFHPEEKVVKSVIDHLGVNLREVFQEINFMGPVPCSILRLNNNYRYQITIKDVLSEKINKKIKDYVYNIVKKKNSNVKISVDINSNELA